MDAHIPQEDKIEAMQKLVDSQMKLIQLQMQQQQQPRQDMTNIPEI